MVVVIGRSCKLIIHIAKNVLVSYKMPTKQKQTSETPTKAQQRCIVKSCKNEFETSLALAKQHEKVILKLVQKHPFKEAVDKFNKYLTVKHPNETKALTVCSKDKCDVKSGRK